MSFSIVIIIFISSAANLATSIFLYIKLDEKIEHLKFDINKRQIKEIINKNTKNKGKQ